MKRLLIAFVFTPFIAAHSYADLKPGDTTVAIFGGAAGSNTSYDFRGNDEKSVTGGGGGFGFQALHYTPNSLATAIGLDVAHSPNGTGRRDDMIHGFESDARLKSTTVLFMGKLIFPKGKLRPYLFSGIGVHSSSLFLSAHPLSGRTWSDGGTDTRVLVDERKTSLALGYGIGIDIFPVENIFFGLELRGVWLGGLRRRLTREAQVNGLGLRDDGSVEQGNLFARVGIKFGN